MRQPDDTKISAVSHRHQQGLIRIMEDVRRVAETIERCQLLDQFGRFNLSANEPEQVDEQVHRTAFAPVGVPSLEEHRPPTFDQFLNELQMRLEVLWNDDARKPITIVADDDGALTSLVRRDDGEVGRFEFVFGDRRTIHGR